MDEKEAEARLIMGTIFLVPFVMVLSAIEEYEISINSVGIKYSIISFHH